jgi:kynurenine 3-monooxygenase
MVFGADGAFSRTVIELQRQSMSQLFERILNYWLQRLNIPANADGSPKLDKTRSYWPRGELHAECLNLEVLLYFIYAFLGEELFDLLKERKCLFLKLILSRFNDVIPELVEDFLKNPTYIGNNEMFSLEFYGDKVSSDRGYLSCNVPFMVKKLNAGFEDISDFV